MASGKLMVCQDCTMIGVPMPENEDTCGNCGSHNVTVYLPASGLTQAVGRTLRSERCFMEDKIGKFIIDGDEAGNFAPHVKVWSEMAVRVIVMRALEEAAQQGFAADETTRLRDLLWVSCLCGACGHSYKYNRGSRPEEGIEYYIVRLAVNLN